MKTRKLLVALILMFSFVLRAEKVPPVGERVAKLYKQQVALQAIIKDFMMIGAGVNPAEAREDLDNKVAFLEESYLDFMDYSESDPKVQNIFEKGSEDWMKLRMIVVDEVNPENASKLVKTNTKLLLLLSDLLNQEKKSGNYAMNKEIENAYKMQIYLDRISAYYYAYIWGIDREVAVRSMAGAQMYFETLKSQLEKSPVNTAAVNGTLTNLENQWVMLKKLSTQLTTSKMFAEEFEDLYKDVSEDVGKIITQYGKVSQETTYSLK